MGRNGPKRTKKERNWPQLRVKKCISQVIKGHKWCSLCKNKAFDNFGQIEFLVPKYLTLTPKQLEFFQIGKFLAQLMSRKLKLRYSSGVLSGIQPSVCLSVRPFVRLLKKTVVAMIKKLIWIIIGLRYLRQEKND